MFYFIMVDATIRLCFLQIHGVRCFIFYMAMMPGNL
jgi:hypothetical protein